MWLSPRSREILEELRDDPPWLLFLSVCVTAAICLSPFVLLYTAIRSIIKNFI